MRGLHILQAVFLCAVLCASPALADNFPGRCEGLTDSERLARADVAGLGEIVKTKCTCAREPFCEYTVRLSAMKKGAAQDVTFTERSILRYYVPSECVRLGNEARRRRGTSEYFYFRRTATGFDAIKRRNCS